MWTLCAMRRVLCEKMSTDTIYQKSPVFYQKIPVCGDVLVFKNTGKDVYRYNLPKEPCILSNDTCVWWCFCFQEYRERCLQIQSTKRALYSIKRYLCVVMFLFSRIQGPFDRFYRIRLYNEFSNTGWRRLIGSPKLQIIFHRRATEYRPLLRKMTYEDKGSYESSPPCITTHTRYMVA